MASLPPTDWGIHPFTNLAEIEQFPCENDLPFDMKTLAPVDLA
jgi:hypothetical protein